MTDLLVVGDIRTMDPARPRVGAVGIRSGQVEAVGDPAEVRRWLPGRVPELAVPGTAVPGFVDSHVHVMWVGRKTSRLDLTGVRSIGELQDRIRRFPVPDSGWVEADAGFDVVDLAEGRLPDRAELDAATGDVPVLLDRKGHDALVNTAALIRAGIGPGSPDPPGGRIRYQAGLLVEQPAVALVRAVMPEPTDATRAGWIGAGQAELLRHGITTAVDPAVPPADLAVYAAVRHRLRTVVMPLGSERVTSAALAHAVAGSGLDRADPAWLRRGPTKLFLDGGGSLGTALRSVPWPGTGGYHGHQTLSTAGLRAHCRAAALAGHGVGVHAVGDAAVDLVLALLAELDRPIHGLGFHLIHAYLGPSDAAMAAARRLGVAVSAHPALQWQAGPDLLARLGEAEAAGANPLRRWLDAGVSVGGGSDGPGPPLAPLFGMWQARTRAVRGRAGPLGPAQAVTAAEALALFTTGAARVARGPGDGTLRPGQPGDLAVLDVDPLDADADALRHGRVTATVVAGQPYP